ncbi:RTX calcium-binding nonapeptide repeat [Rhabdaerophilaceae bacterium]
MTTKFWSQERQVNVVGTGSQRQPDVAVLSNGDYVVAFSDQAPSPDVVRVQRYNPFGEPIGAEITVGTTTATFPEPSITALPNGTFAVAWLSTIANISLQKFNADGTPNGSVIPVATNGTSLVAQPVGILGLADGTIAVAYTKLESSETDAILKIVAANGTVGSEIVVDATIGSLQQDAYLASNGSNLVVTWFDFSVNDGDIQARTFTLAGGSPSAEVTLNTSVTGTQIYSPITALPGGGYVTVWPDGNDNFLRGQFLSSSLAKQGGEFIVSLENVGSDHIAVAATQNGNFFVAYRENGGVLYGQAMTALGTLDGPRVRIADSVNGNGVGLSALPDGRIAATWNDDSGLDGSGNGVFTRILDPRNGVVDGTSVANTLYGHQSDGDQIAGFGGNDTIFGLGGADVLDGGAGNDSVFGGGDHDLLYGYLGNDILFGDAGNDTAFGWDGADQIGGQDGNDFLIGERGNDTLWGDGGNDQIGGSDGADELYGFADNDTLWGDGGNDRLEGGAGADELYGFADNDTLDGQDGDDRLAGGTGNDTMFGGPGNDVINGEDNDDQLFGFAGNDTLYGGAGADDLLGEGDDDFMWGFTGNDTLQGGPGNDTLGGEAGNDTFVYFSGFGNDQIIGFEPGGSEGDVVRLLGIAGLTNYSQVTSAMSTFGGNVVLNAGPGNSITFVGINSTGVFDQNDFAFV